jgi:hypothetical protein
MREEDLEKYSCAVTLSDMEVFVFPELVYSLLLANIMSPIIWRWRELDCFKKLEGKNSFKKLLRLRQYIMDEYDFNLDLETWGLTDKTRELKRFEKFISPAQIAGSNALFGYEGDKYYFDVDIRRHFGLDKYNSDAIPYWKTETVEAMEAFPNKPGYTKRAGECVSLSDLYAAAAFIVCGIPLEDIYTVVTPLHSQNFIDIQDGVLTNNRRLVTRAMWFNGTAISNKAQRALRNENVTIVSHCTGHVHCLYKDATIGKDVYRRFAGRLNSYLSAELTPLTFANFLRCSRKYQAYFQVCRDCHGQAVFVPAEVLFHYEHGSKFRVADATHDKLLEEISDEDFVAYPIPGRIRCDDLDKFLKERKVDVRTAEGRAEMKKFLAPAVPDAGRFVDGLADFLHIEAKLPADDKNYVPGEPIRIDVKQSREEIIEYLRGLRVRSPVADLAFYAYRDMETCDWRPFVKAAVERSPVSIEMTKAMSIEDVFGWLGGLADNSIYDGNRLAQPDEVANYRTGDGIEKAFVLANIIRRRQPQQDIEVTIRDGDVVVRGGGEYRFTSSKGLAREIRISGTDGNIVASG